jgi:hypothetical protein
MHAYAGQPLTPSLVSLALQKPSTSSYTIAVKRGVDGGHVSAHLHDKVQVGDILPLSPPHGDFHIENVHKLWISSPQAPVVLLSAGWFLHTQLPPPLVSLRPPPSRSDILRRTMPRQALASPFFPVAHRPAPLLDGDTRASG